MRSIEGYRAEAASIRAIDQAIPEPNSGCWLWEKRLNKKGYGVLYINGKSTLAHRACWEETFGDIPKGMLICHRCDVPACVNPEHLFIGSHSDNMADMARKGRGCRLALVHRKGNTHQVRLSDSIVSSILLAGLSGASLSTVAATHHTSKTSVWNIIHNKTWRHVPRPVS